MLSLIQLCPLNTALVKRTAQYWFISYWEDHQLHWVSNFNHIQFHSSIQTLTLTLQELFISYLSLFIYSKKEINTESSQEVKNDFFSISLIASSFVLLFIRGFLIDFKKGRKVVGSVWMLCLPHILDELSKMKPGPERQFSMYRSLLNLLYKLRGLLSQVILIML